MRGLEHLVERFDHVAYGVRRVEDALPLVMDLLAGRFHDGGDNRRGGFRWVQFLMPGRAKLELIQPLSEDCFLHDFLSRRGEGLHHLTYKVRDVVEAARRAEELGFQTLGLWTEHPAWKEVFLHPSSAHGAVIQLAQWEDRAPRSALEDVLAGRVVDDA